MLKSKFGRKLAASATALAMVATASASSISALTASAGNLLGEGTFEEGSALPWHICENGTASMAFTIDDGVYSILIKNPGGASNGGEDRWDCQFRHRTLSITYGHKYRITYSVYATNSGRFYSKIGDINNNDAEYWHQCGNKLGLEYKEHMTQDELVSALKSASPSKETDKSNQSSWDVPYYEGWNSWKADTISAKKWTTWSFEFYIDKSYMQNVAGNEPEGKGTVEWTFHFGGDGSFTDSPCFPEGTIIKFDNLALVDMDGDQDDYVAEEKVAKTGLVYNQLGYYPGLDKVATLQVKEGTAAQEFSIVDASGKVVKTGTTSATKYESAADEYCQTLDFSDVTAEGTYKIKVGDITSHEFKISKDLYGSMLTDALNYYYLNRSGVDIEEKYVANAGKNASKSALARKAGHNPDKAYITDEWVFIYDEKTNDEIASRYSSNGQIDVTGGWYDAGDYGKYVVNGGVSMWTLANIYERDAVKNNLDKWKDGSDVMNIPETGNGTPDILDELSWEAEFFLKMQREDGMVYHKMHDYKWTGLGVMPYDDVEGTGEAAEKERNTNFPARIVKPVTYTATLNAAATLAQLSRLIKPYDSAKASEYLAAAEKAYKAAKDAYTAKYKDIYASGVTGNSDDDPMFAPLDQNKGGGPYGDTQASDEFYWAACELYVTTENDDYYADVTAYPDAFEVTTNLVGGENKGSPTSFTWGTLSALGTATLALHEDLVKDAADYKKIEQQFQEAGDFYLKTENQSMYGTPYPGCTYDAVVTYVEGDTSTEKTVTLEGGYEWGSNSMVANNAMILGMAYDVTGNVKYLNGVTTAFDYLLGRNPNENSYVTGYGFSTTENPHHRYWCHQLKNDWPSAPNGCLSGGPNSNMNDPMIQGAGYKIGELAPMKCYYDQVDAWSVNEITINWNAPLVWVASFVEDEAPKADGSEIEDTTDSTDPGKVKYGDVNVDDTVTISDVIALNKYLLGDAKAASAQGLINADVDVNNSIDSTDSLNILKACVQLLDADKDFPIK